MPIVCLRVRLLHLLLRRPDVAGQSRLPNTSVGSVSLLLRCERSRVPNVSLFKVRPLVWNVGIEREAEVRWHHAHDGVLLAIQLNHFPDNRRSTSKLGSPKSAADDDCVIEIGPIIFRSENSAN